MKHDRYNFLSALEPVQYENVRALVIDLVLATDLKEHFKVAEALCLSASLILLTHQLVPPCALLVVRFRSL
jgi:hypothetical protein